MHYGRYTHGNHKGTLYFRNGEGWGAIIIPKEARQVFDIKAGDTLIVLGDEKWGIAVTKADVLEKHAYDVFKKISEGQTDADQ